MFQRIARVILVGVLVVLSLVVATPANASAQVSSTLNSISRTSSGSLALNLDATASGFRTAGQLCGAPVSPSSCQMFLEVRRASDGAVQALFTWGNFGSYGDPAAVHFASNANAAKIDAVRVRLTNGVDSVTSAWSTASDPYPDAELVSLSMSEFSRMPSGVADYAMSATASGYRQPGRLCASVSPSACKMVIEVRHPADGSVEAIDTTSYFGNYGDPGTLVVDSSKSLSTIDAIRARLTNGIASVTGTWVLVSDPYPQAESVAITVSEFSRTATGSADYVLGVTAHGYKQPGRLCASVSPSSCVMMIEVRHPADGSVEAIETTSYFGNYGDPGTLVVDTTHNISTIDAIRARLTNGVSSVTGAWVPVFDPYPISEVVSIVVNSVSRNVSGQLEFDIEANAMGFLQPGRVCRSSVSGINCALNIDVRHVSDASVQLAYTRTYMRNYGDPATITAQFDVSMATIDAIRVRLTNGSQTITGEWIPTSENITGGHDVDGALALAIAGLSRLGATEACMAYVPVGTYALHSSLNDQQLACLSATNGGLTFAQFIQGYIGSLTARQVTQMLVAAGVSVSEATKELSPDLDYGKTLPVGCSWATATSIVCDWSPDPIRPISAPPKQDDVWENNQGSVGERDRVKTGTPPDPIPAPTPGGNPAPTQAEMHVLLREQCEKYVLDWQVQAGLSEDACETKPIFGSGIQAPQATIHDLDAIVENPSWFELSYVSNAEKTARGESRPDWASVAPSICANQPTGYECDEYPYFSTQEGWPEANPPDLLSIPGLTDNRVQGGYLTAFYKGCPKFQKPETLGTADREFLVVPIPFLPFWKHYPPSCFAS